MHANKSLWFQPRVFAVGELRLGLATVLKDLKYDPTDFSISVTQTLPDGAYHSDSDLTLDDLATVCDLRNPKVSVYVEYSGKGGAPTLRVKLRADSDGFLEIEVSTGSPALLGEFASATARNLSLSPAASDMERHNERIKGRPAISEQIDRLSQRLESLEKRTAAGRMVAFLSFRFDGKSRSYSDEVHRFLEQLDTQVITAEAYEPRPVSQKVRQKLSNSINMVVLILTSDGQSSWVRDEVAKAQQPDVYLVPIVERGVQFEPGIFGDHEYIEFTPDHIGDAFLKLLEAVTFVRLALRSKKEEASDLQAESSQDKKTANTTGSGHP